MGVEGYGGERQKNNYRQVKEGGKIQVEKRQVGSDLKMRKDELDEHMREEEDEG